VELIGNTTTCEGLQVKTAIDPKQSKPGIKLSDEQLADVCLQPHDFHVD
jgi:hypothetical protein